MKINKKSGSYICKVFSSNNNKDITLVNSSKLENCMIEKSSASVVSPFIILKNYIVELDSSIVVHFFSDEFRQFSGCEFYYYTEFGVYALKTIDTSKESLPYIYVFIKILFLFLTLIISVNRGLISCV